MDLSAYSPASNVLLKWNELPGVQVWGEYFRGDLRPQVELKRCTHEFLYCDELTEKLDVVRDDLIQTLELALKFEKCRTRILRRKLTRVGRNLTAAKDILAVDVDTEFKVVIKDELAHNRLTSFAYRTNREYNNALRAHYAGFQPNTRLLDESIHERIYSSIEESFPLHFSVLRSLIFLEQAHKPLRRKNKGYNGK